MSNTRRSVVRALYQALGGQNFGTAATLVDPNVLLLNVATGDVYRGRAGFLEYSRSWISAFPDLRYTQLKLVASEEGAVIAEYELTGTHTGPLVTPRGHIPPTLAEVELRFCDVIEFRDGAIAHIRTYFDTVSLLRHFGLIGSTPLHAPERRAGLEMFAEPIEVHAPQRNKAIVQRLLYDVINRRDADAVSDTCTENFRWHGGALGEARGRDAYRDVITSFLAAFPDLQLEIMDMVAEGDRVVVRLQMSGTHLGEFQGIEPTSRHVRGGVTSTYRCENGRIAEEWWQGDVTTLLQPTAPTPFGPPLER